MGTKIEGVVPLSITTQMAAFKSGLKFEEKVAARLRQLSYAGVPITCIKTAGGGSGPDVPFKAGENSMCMEAKTKGAFEGGQKVFKFVDGVLTLPPDSVHKSILGDYVPFKGVIPPFLQKKITLHEWLEVKNNFQGEYAPTNATNLVANYYNSKGSKYIQIEGLGLYRTSEEDPLELGVPLLECNTKFRIRCKQHKGKIPSSVMCSLTYNKKSIKKSPYDIMYDERLPPGLTVLPAESEPQTTPSSHSSHTPTPP